MPCSSPAVDRAGFTCIPPAVGAAHVLVLPVVILLYVRVWLPFRYPGYEDDPVLCAYYKGENARNLFDNDGFKSTLNRAAIQKHQEWFLLTPVEQSRLVFDMLDKDSSGAIDAEELSAVLDSWHSAYTHNSLVSHEGRNKVQKLLELAKEGPVTFEIFHRHVAKGGIYTFTDGLRFDEENARDVEALKLIATFKMSPREKFDLAFKAFAGERGSMDRACFFRFSSEMLLPTGLMEFVVVPMILHMMDKDRDGVLTAEEMWEFRNTAIVRPLWQFFEQYNQARIVFEVLDVDDSGTVSVDELSELLMQWGMPEWEADATMKHLTSAPKVRLHILERPPRLCCVVRASHAARSRQHCTWMPSRRKSVAPHPPTRRWTFTNSTFTLSQSGSFPSTASNNHLTSTIARPKPRRHASTGNWV